MPEKSSWYSGEGTGRGVELPHGYAKRIPESNNIIHKRGGSRGTYNDDLHC